ncbi:MACPF domain-containing protein [Heracleum sosnowskyi]|uniref:MACPF domain-containing protein n=1 Tax=Heracleum sosnowskyi TaxID=360622 RepID=A0AAD8LW50_9APIA|nr:MACPF domain-containing protein [Heracleum sosnowskyi]
MIRRQDNISTELLTRNHQYKPKLQMTHSDAIVRRALDSLGKGFDLTSDFRLKYCKGKDSLVSLTQDQTKQLSVPGFGLFNDVSTDIKCGKGDRTRYQSDILDFKQMSEFMNQKCSVPGKIPSGWFNSMFGFESESWQRDAARTKYLGLDGYFILLFDLHINRYPLQLLDQVKTAVPSTWDPSSLARFIEIYGTHIIVGLGIGGQDTVVVRQDKSSNLEASELKKNLYELGDQLFNGTCTFTPKDQKHKAPPAFNVFDQQSPFLDNLSSVKTKNGINVICSKRGGDVSAMTHSEWLLTVPLMPDAVQFNFIPITSLLKGVPGNGFLSHAINLYLRYKPPLADLKYFLDFQNHKLWAPIHSELTLGPASNKGPSNPSLEFNLMAPKLYVNTTQVAVDKRPITGMRLYLEGMKCNRLAIHLQHLANTPQFLQNRLDDTHFWRGTEDSLSNGYLEPIQWKNFSYISTAPVKYDPDWTTTGENATFIVTGTQLHVEKYENSKTALHLRLLYSKVSNSYIVKSNWMQCQSDVSQKSGFFSAISQSINLGGISDKEDTKKVVLDSSVYPSGPPVAVQTKKLLKFVDMSELCSGPSDSPGHWLVTGAKLQLEKGKICMHVKFSLLNVL